MLSADSREATEMFLKRDAPHLLIVGMTGVKMGDRLVQIGCANGGRLAAVAGKVGLSGRAVLVAPDEASALRGRRGRRKRRCPCRSRDRAANPAAARCERLRRRRRRRHGRTLRRDARRRSRSGDSRARAHSPPGGAPAPHRRCAARRHRCAPFTRAGGPSLRRRRGERPAGRRLQSCENARGARGLGFR